MQFANPYNRLRRVTVLSMPYIPSRHPRSLLSAEASAITLNGIDLFFLFLPIRDLMLACK